MAHYRKCWHAEPVVHRNFPSHQTVPDVCCTFTLHPYVTGPPLADSPGAFGTSYLGGLIPSPTSLPNESILWSPSGLFFLGVQVYKGGDVTRLGAVNDLAEDEINLS